MIAIAKSRSKSKRGVELRWKERRRRRPDVEMRYVELRAQSGETTYLVQRAVWTGETEMADVYRAYAIAAGRERLISRHRKRKPAIAACVRHARLAARADQNQPSRERC